MVSRAAKTIITNTVREPSMPESAHVIRAPIAHKAAGADPYAWLQERDTDAVLDYLKAENAYQEAQTADQAALRESLFEEIKGRILETDLSLPSPWGRICITRAPRRVTNTPGITAARVRPTTA